MKIAIGSDHAGYRLKEILKAHLKKRGYRVIDMGTNSEESVDYPLYCFPVAVAVAKRRVDRGIVLGGSGNGEAMTANRVKGVRCGLCWNEVSARLTRMHNDANVLSLGGRLIPRKKAIRILDIFLTTPFEGGRHVRRIARLDKKPNAEPPKKR